ncbi:MAG: ferrous iron transport protein B [Planctomycetota bacterium]|jgi:ferrous iron transport protein B|nr:ferrous iron transport protein B [Planctomycetota bacterium]MDP6837454.1 ferrous iron transport protein B [Planctomycetota bacterium]
MGEARLPFRVALAGNPNTGKTTLFNRLTGSDQKVGNYPGITVDRHTGHMRLPGIGHVDVLDVPGAYSLSARSPEEQLAIQTIAGIPPYPTPDVVVQVLDATQLSRNLYLLLQIIETGVPVVVALNMTDMLAARGEAIDVPALEQQLGVPVVAVSALHRQGLAELSGRVAEVLANPDLGRTNWRWQPQDGALLEDMALVSAAVPESWCRGSLSRRRSFSLWALLSIDDADELSAVPEDLRNAVAAARASATRDNRELESEVIGGRYRWIDEHLPTFLEQRSTPGPSRTERLDAILLHPASGFLIFLALMGVVFQTLFSGADPAIAFVEGVFGTFGEAIEDALLPGFLRDFLVNGVVAGVGSVLVFLPQILLLFLFIGLMEDTGYMARVAFLMDRIMKSLGLHGRAFVPMMSGFACAVPAIMATRTMERRRDRFLTMMVVPLMTCSARLPVYSLIIAALFPPAQIFGFVPVQGLLMVAMYLFSTVVALLALAVLGRTIFRGPRVPLILELPPYRRPHLPTVLRMVAQRGAVFVREAGSVILVCTIGLWFLLSHPINPPLATDYDALRVAATSNLETAALEERLATISSEETGALLRASYAGRVGQAIEPVIEPLGFDWKIGVGLIGAFAAREVFVSTMGVVYGLGAEEDEGSHTLRESIRRATHADGRPVYTPLVGLSLMVFFALACQCMATLAAVRRETHTWRWPAFMLVYMTALAWCASFLLYQGGLWLGFS